MGTVGNRQMLSPRPDGSLLFDNHGPLAMASPNLRPPPSALDSDYAIAASPPSALDPYSERSIPVSGLSHWARSPQPAARRSLTCTDPDGDISKMSPLNDTLPRYSMAVLDDQPVPANTKKRPEDIFIPTPNTGQTTSCPYGHRAGLF